MWSCSRWGTRVPLTISNPAVDGTMATRYMPAGIVFRVSLRWMVTVTVPGRRPNDEVLAKYTVLRTCPIDKMLLSVFAYFSYLAFVEVFPSVLYFLLSLGFKFVLKMRTAVGLC